MIDYIHIYIYIYIYHIEGAVFTTIWCSMYKVQSVDSRSAIYIYIYISTVYTYKVNVETSEKGRKQAKFQNSSYATLVSTRY